jgi:hypothetical protein
VRFAKRFIYGSYLYRKSKKAMENQDWKLKELNSFSE